MKLDSFEYSIYENIEIIEKYKLLSKKYQSDEEFNYSNKDVLNLIAKLNQKAKFVRKNNFFKVENKVKGIKFYINISLKYNLVELIIGATDILKDTFITGGSFGWICKDFEIAQGINVNENIKKPSFGNYEELENILGVAFEIYEDFKVEFLKKYIV